MKKLRLDETYCEMTHQEVANVLGVSRSRIIQIEQKALKKLLFNVMARLLYLEQIKEL